MKKPDALLPSVKAIYFLQPKILGVPRNQAFRLCAIFFQLDIYFETSKYSFYNLAPFKRRELVTTETEEKAMAAPAIAGLRTIPKMGKSKPAAIGILKTL